MTRWVRGGWAGAVVMGTALAGLGCGAQPAPLLPADAFVNRRPAIGPESNHPIDRPGALVYEGQHEPPHEAGSGQKLSPVVEKVIPTRPAPAAEAVAAPTTEPAPQPQTSPSPTGISTSQYQIVGTVVATVNGRPIFADKVLSRIDRQLAALARQYRSNLEQFQFKALRAASEEIATQIHDEVEFAAAQKALTKADEDLAARLTTEWVNIQIRQAGGSEVLVRQREAQQGVNFDEEKREQYRLNMVRIYYEKKIVPLIQISAQDMRTYYQQNIRQYTVSSAAQFRVIRIDKQKSGGPEQAFEKARRIYDQAKSGEDFADLATKYNDDPLLMRNKGLVGVGGWMEKGAYAIDAVEEAVWQLHPGEVTPPINTGDAFYVAKLEALRQGRTRQFENPEVQDQISRTLREQQLSSLRERQIQELMKDSVVTTPQSEQQMQATLWAMIMQRYPAWVAAK